LGREEGSGRVVKNLVTWYSSVTIDSIDDEVPIESRESCDVVRNVVVATMTTKHFNSPRALNTDHTY
jgi:hypothetical protein